LKCGQRAWVYDGIGESGFQRMKIDKDIENVLNTDWLLDKLNRIDKMNEEERKEILEQLRVEADRVLEKNRRGESIMDQIEKHATTLSPEDRKLFYLNLNKRWSKVAEEGLKRLRRRIEIVDSENHRVV
jgi:hypothetical protein